MGPPYSPDIGETFYAISTSPSGSRRFYYPMTVTRVTAKQVEAADPRGRKAKFWREKWAELGDWRFARRISIHKPDDAQLSAILKGYIAE